MKVKLHEYAVDSCTKCIVMHTMTVIGCINPRCACAMNLHFCAFIFLKQELYIYGSGGYDEGGYIEGVSGCGVIMWLND